MNLSKVTTALALSVALAATLAAAPQGTKPAPSTKAPAKTAEKATKKSAAAKADTVKPADLPKAVTDAVMKAHPKGEITMATKAMKDSTTWYTVTVKDGAKTSKMTLDDMGKPAASAAKKKGK